MRERNLKSEAARFVVLIGLVSLFADMTYEGARSITGPYLEVFGASAAVVGFVAGFGELTGYGLRLLSGLITDRTRKYWTVTIVGYAVNLLAVPMLALAGNWPAAAALLIAERTGKAIRSPARDAMLSHATKQLGHGWGFGLHEAMDQTGAMAGPLIAAAVLGWRGDYRVCFAVLLIPAVLALTALLTARFLYPRPDDLSVNLPRIEPRGFSRSYWFYLAGAGLIAAGYADFPLIAYHFEKFRTVPKIWIPVFYATAMGSDAAAALVFGRLYDRAGFRVLIATSIIGAFFAPLVFFGGFYGALAGMIVWGIGMGAQESVMRAAVAEMAPSGKRGTAFGVFNAFYGILWFSGSVALGLTYAVSIPLVVLLSVLLQTAALPLFLLSLRKSRTA